MKTTITAVTVALATAVFAFGEPPKGKGERGGDRPVQGGVGVTVTK